MIPDLLHVAYKTYHFDNYTFSFMPMKYTHLNPMFRDTVFVDGETSCIAPIHRGKVSWGKRKPSQACRNYIEAIVVKDWARICENFGWPLDL